MNLNGITNEKSYDNNKTGKIDPRMKVDKDIQNKPLDDTAVIYEKSNVKENSKGYHKLDEQTIEKMKRDVEKRTEGLRKLVEKMLLKQGQKLMEGDNLYELLRDGKVIVDDKTREQAQKDIAEDGYWGVQQTSDRLVSFAKALSGNDPAKAEEMISAVKKGFEEATKTWGAELPEICKKTLEVTIQKLKDWKESA